MRKIVMLLALVLVASPAVGQERAATAPAEQKSTQVQAAPASPAVSSLYDRILPDPAAPVAAEERVAASARAQPSGRDFLWHIVFTAISALVTALIWKAVFND